ncbi:MAG: DNA cytosine methyltransferase [Armatimonadota bacterium]|nr:DNA cytosine methyltransferase [Armatimonadota bacterium]
MPTIPVIDLFAGPGGLGEGFSSFKCGDTHPFKVRLSVEKDANAYRTLKLRSFFRQFASGYVPADYYAHLRGQITLNELFELHPEEAEAVEQEALHRELGKLDDDRVVDDHIAAVLRDTDSAWVLIGGPPCQAYSTVGRSRMKGSEDFEDDKRHFLYREYLRIILKFRPPVFVMENVTGILSATVAGKSTIARILKDLAKPSAAMTEENEHRSPDESSLRYRIYSLATETDPEQLEPADFVIKSEDYGIPQARHRVILLGVRDDVEARPGTLEPHEKRISVGDVISDLPVLRSRLSKETDSDCAWQEAVASVAYQEWLEGIDEDLKAEIWAAVARMDGALGHGEQFVAGGVAPLHNKDWYYDAKLLGVCNHMSRGHIKSDLHRYFFVACYGEINSVSPRMRHFPKALLPNHDNVQKAVQGKMFPDRFRVQVRGAVATTITSHISKDGHYFIHYDPCQCRSLTVREAARIQTFPDNYYFEGDRTPQYKQVGNAVPPLLARQIAAIVHQVLEDASGDLGDNGHSEQREEKLEYVADSLQEHQAGTGGAVHAAPDGVSLPRPLCETAGKA